MGDFGSFLDLVNKVKGPVNCGKFKDCGKCTGVANAGLCGWFATSRNRNNPFGGFVSGGSGGNCKFVDRSVYSSEDKAKPTTCANQCKKKKSNHKNKKDKNKNKNSKKNNFRPQPRV